MKRYKMGVRVILLTTVVSLLLFVYLWFYDRTEKGIFVGLWVLSILSFGALVVANCYTVLTDPAVRS